MIKNSPRIRMLFFILPLLLLFFHCNYQQPAVVPGVDVLINEHLTLIQGKRIALITDRTAVSANGQHIIYLLTQTPDIQLKTVLSLDHGIEGNQSFSSGFERYFELSDQTAVYRTTLQNRTVTFEQLDSVDVILFDVQDIGSRLSTYIQSMALAMKSAANKRIPFIVLDRPNPLTGEIVAGPVNQLNSDLYGNFPIPIRHGVTLGELARMISGEGWLDSRNELELHVIPMKNWHRLEWFDQTSLPWIRPSAAINSLDQLLLFPGMKLLEAADLSIGRGSRYLFHVFGAPWMDTEQFKIPSLLPWRYGFQMEPVQFLPQSSEDQDSQIPYQDQLCRGYKINIYDRNVFRSVSMAVYLLDEIQKNAFHQIQFNDEFDQLIGNTSLRLKLTAGVPAKEIISAWQLDINRYKDIREKYLLY